MAATLSYRFRGSTRTLCMPGDAPLSEVAAALAEAHSLDASTLRLLGKGASHQLSAGGVVNQLGTGPFMLLGTPAAELAELGAAAEKEAQRAQALRLPSAEHEALVNAQRLAGGAASTSGRGASTELFAAYKVLPAVPGAPAPSQALQLLHALASDAGIVRVMRARRWRVGLLSEMPPEGKVGVSAVCVLGYNVNAGAEISLRLRTDDMLGFRLYERVRETLIHELAHMTYSEHDLRFKALNSELTREARVPDFRRSEGRSTGGPSAALLRPAVEAEARGRTLGGHAEAADARDAAAAAALAREAERAMAEEAERALDEADG